MRSHHLVPLSALLQRLKMINKLVGVNEGKGGFSQGAREYLLKIITNLCLFSL